MLLSYFIARLENVSSDFKYSIFDNQDQSPRYYRLGGLEVEMCLLCQLPPTESQLAVSRQHMQKLLFAASIQLLTHMVGEKLGNLTAPVLR